jgi:hypothetical protein
VALSGESLLHLAGGIAARQPPLVPRWVRCSPALGEGSFVINARTALFLACDERSYTTGRTVYPNRGMYAS